MQVDGGGAGMFFHKSKHGGHMEPRQQQTVQAILSGAKLVTFCGSVRLAWGCVFPSAAPSLSCLQQPFPKKFPFSEFVPRVYNQIKEFIYACLKFSEDLHLRYDIQGGRLLHS